MYKSNSFSKLEVFSCSNLPQSEKRNKWLVWHRGFEICLRACQVTDPFEKKNLLLSEGGLELQEIFFNIPGADVGRDDKKGLDPYKVAVKKLNNHFAPRRLEVKERNEFWTMQPESGESLPMFYKRVQNCANKCNFGATAKESEHNAVIDKIMQFVPMSLHNNLLQESKLTLDDMTRRLEVYETSSPPNSSNNHISEPPCVSSEEIVEYNRNSFNESGKPHRNCGQFHGRNKTDCPALNTNCSNCGKLGHFGSLCTIKQGGGSGIIKSFKKKPYDKNGGAGGYQGGKKMKHEWQMYGMDYESPQNY
ncbi:uncharacterized protein LOC134220324 [Armigeres subalbatus]|uniref:uncharacterized protein LOC134220324 n=1 Tax=Armigeres subalbatus TaxID=124917 RepID=UPI002ED16BAC